MCKYDVNPPLHSIIDMHTLTHTWPPHAHYWPASRSMSAWGVHECVHTMHTHVDVCMNIERCSISHVHGTSTCVLDMYSPWCCVHDIAWCSIMHVMCTTSCPEHKRCGLRATSCSWPRSLTPIGVQHIECNKLHSCVVHLLMQWTHCKWLLARGVIGYNIVTNKLVTNL